jgi:hypothetical protein
MSELSMQRYDKNAVRVLCDGEVVGMLLRHCDDMWSINDAQEKPLTKRRLRSAKRAFDYAKDTELFAPVDRSGEADETRQGLGPEGESAVGEAEAPTPSTLSNQGSTS